MSSSIKFSLGLLVALSSAGAMAPAFAQTVYKCGHRTYSEVPCAPKKVVNTSDAPVPVKPNPNEVDQRRIAQNQALSQSLRRLPGETDAQYSKRRHRTAMLQEDRDECARLDTRIPFERERMKNPDPEEVDKAQVGLSDSKKRYKQLHC